MKCPIDGSDLVMSDRQGIEIDYCPKCRGVWLDRGELDKIIERSAGGFAAEPAGGQAAPASSGVQSGSFGAPGYPAAPPPAQPYPQGQAYPQAQPYPPPGYPPQGQGHPQSYRRYDDDDDKRRYDPRYGHDPRYGQGHYPHGKRKSFLGELFDFD